MFEWTDLLWLIPMVFGLPLLGLFLIYKLSGADKVKYKKEAESSHSYPPAFKV